MRRPPLARYSSISTQIIHLITEADRTRVSLHPDAVRVHMPRKNTDSVQVASRWFTNGVVVPSLPLWGCYTLGLLLYFLSALLVNAGFIMNHFYAPGAYLVDSGMLADLAWHNGTNLPMPPVSGGESHLGTHVS